VGLTFGSRSRSESVFCSNVVFWSCSGSVSGFKKVIWFFYGFFSVFRFFKRFFVLLGRSCYRTQFGKIDMAQLNINFDLLLTKGL
jgi:hypothetical protein